MKKHVRSLLFLVAAMISLAGCVATNIARINADPARYRNRDVRVEGTVTSAVGAFVAGVYQVDDGTGKIYVLSTRGIPAKGTRVRVTGNVTEGVSVLGRSFGTTIRERDHKIHY
jgi:hypothetical protein